MRQSKPAQIQPHVCAHNGTPPPFSRLDQAKLGFLEVLWALRPGARVLEFGCGAGRLTGRLAGAVGASGRVRVWRSADGVGSPTRPPGLAKRDEAIGFSAFLASFETESFDHAVCINSFSCFWAPAEALAALRHVLKPGGKLWVAHLRGEAEPWRWPCANKPVAFGRAEHFFRRLPHVAAAAGFRTASVAHCAGVSWFQAEKTSDPWELGAAVAVDGPSWLARVDLWQREAAGPGIEGHDETQ